MLKHTRRLKRIAIDPRRFFAAIRDSIISISCDLPADAKYVGFDYDTSSNTNFFIVESKEFEEVEEGEVIPRFDGDILVREIK